jgi:hypothetical protein
VVVTLSSPCIQSVFTVPMPTSSGRGSVDLATGTGFFVWHHGDPEGKRRRGGDNPSDQGRQRPCRERQNRGDHHHEGPHRQRRPELREQLQDLPRMTLIERCAGLRRAAPRSGHDCDGRHHAHSAGDRPPVAAITVRN